MGIAQRAAAPADSLSRDLDLYLFNEGTHARLFEKLGAHPLAAAGGPPRTYFAVWAPNAQAVSVIGDFNGWDQMAHRLAPRGQSGIWEGVIGEVGPGACYKFHIIAKQQGYQVDKRDPFAFHGE